MQRDLQDTSNSAGGMDMDQYGMIREILEKSTYTVAMCGTDMMKESGMQSMRAPEISYKVEREYGYSPEEIFSSVFYTNRTGIWHFSHRGIFFASRMYSMGYFFPQRGHSLSKMVP